MGKTYPHMSSHKMTYHGRTKKGMIHKAKSGRKYVMVRHPSGRGTKRLYLNKYGNIPAKHRS